LSYRRAATTCRGDDAGHSESTSRGSNGPESTRITTIAWRKIFRNCSHFFRSPGIAPLQRPADQVSELFVRRDGRNRRTRPGIQSRRITSELEMPCGGQRAQSGAAVVGSSRSEGRELPCSSSLTPFNTSCIKLNQKRGRGKQEGELHRKSVHYRERPPLANAGLRSSPCRRRDFELALGLFGHKVVRMKGVSRHQDAGTFAARLMFLNLVRWP